MKYFLDTEFLEGIQANKPSKLSFGRKHKPTIDLISIGIVCEDGREFYTISKDFNLKEAWNRYDEVKDGFRDYGMTPNFKKVYWIRDNVLKPIYLELKEKEVYEDCKSPYKPTFDNSLRKEVVLYMYNISSDKKNYKEFKRLIKKYGKTNKQIAEEIKDFISCKSIYGRKDGLILEGLTHEFRQSYDGRIELLKRKNQLPKFYGYYCDYDWVVFCWLFGKMIDLPKGFPMYCIDLKQTLDEKSKYSLAKPITNDINYPKQTNEHNALADAKWNYELYKFLQTL